MHSRVLDPCGIVRVQSWNVSASAPSAVDQVVGAVWPRDVGTVARGSAHVLCVGPTEWLVIAGNGDELCRSLGAVLVGSPLRPTNMSHELSRVEFEGPGVREFLLEGCSLDLHPGHFPPGRCARARFAGVPIVLHCCAPSRFEGIVAASQQDYLLAWIAAASA
jgi:sarcosine oxidase, subunit gamma